MQVSDTAAVLQAAGTAAIADIFDQLSMPPPVLDTRLFPIVEGSVFAGPAYTVTGKSAAYIGGDRRKLEAIDGMMQGVVAVWAGQDAEGVCCFGDLLATAMRARGVVAAVVDGGVRDVRFLRGCGMPVVTRYRTPAQGVGRWKVTSYQAPVQMRGGLSEWLTVVPGDMYCWGFGWRYRCAPSPWFPPSPPRPRNSRGRRAAHARRSRRACRC